MGYTLFILFLVLAFSLVLYLVRKGNAGKFAKFFRVATVLFGISIFTYWFFEKSIDKLVKDSLSVQVVNKLPQKIDFYMVKVQGTKENHSYIVKHFGDIRPEYFRIEYLDMDHSDEFWIAGYLGKKNMVYFSQHSVNNKNIDQIIEIRNYINQSEKLSSLAKNFIEKYNYSILNLGIWASLDLLLLFLNLVLLLRKNKIFLAH